MRGEGRAISDIFLSYNRNDQSVARRFADALEREGFAVWWDVTIETGEAYDVVTENVLKSAKAVVVLWSPRSVVSRWVRSEATVADRNNTLLPVMIEPCERPIMFELTQTASLEHWDGSPDDPNWRTFVNDVRKFMARGAAVNASPDVIDTPTTRPIVSSAVKTPTGNQGSMPSLAVLPFTNRSRIEDDEIFAEGMVEDIIAALSQSAMLKVLGSMSTAHLTKGSFTDYASVGKMLGVTYLMEGNVRRAGRDFSVTTQLLNAATGHVVWTGKFAKPLDDLQDLQEQLVTEVASALDTKITVIDMERALRKPDDITAWEAVQRSLLGFRRMDAEGLQIALVEAKRAVDIAPDFAIAHAMLAHVLASFYLLFIPDDPEKIAEIKSHVHRAMQLNPHSAEELIFISHALSYIGQFEDGVVRAEEAYALAPNNGLAAFAVGVTSCLLDKPEQAIRHLDIADQLMPGSYVRVYVLAWHANALARADRWTECEAMWEKCLLVDPHFMQGHLQMSILYWRDGHREKAASRMRMIKDVGIDNAMATLWIRRLYMNSSLRDGFLRIFDDVWAATEMTADA